MTLQTLGPIEGVQIAVADDPRSWSEQFGITPAAGRGALVDAVATTLTQAADRDLKELVLRLTGTGNHDPDDVARTLMGALRRHLDRGAPARLRRIVLLGPDEATVDALRNAYFFEDLGPADDPPEPGDHVTVVGIRLSRNAYRLLTTAAEITSLAGRGRVDAEAVLAATLACAGSNGTGAALRHLLERLPPAFPEAVLHDVLTALGIRPNTLQAPAEPFPDDLVPPPGVGDLVRLAGNLLWMPDWDGLVHSRHLIGLAVAEQPFPAEIATALRVPGKVVRAAFRAAVIAQTDDVLIRDAVAEAWSELLGLESPVELAGGFSPDAVDPRSAIPSTEDQLEFGPYVAMLATLIADRSTPLPLSVGLFGEWGSGKSYFMGLLRTRISRLGSIDQGAYLNNVVHIHFNAWHYADDDIWASLGDRIFADLDDPRATRDNERARRQKNLAEAETQVKDLEERAEAAGRRAGEARDELERARQQRTVSAREIIMAAARTDTGNRALRRAGRALGLPAASDRVRVLESELRGTGREITALRAAVSSLGGYALTVLGAALLAGLAVFALWPDGPPGTVVLRTGVAVASGWLSLAALVLARARRGLHWLSRAVSEVGENLRQEQELALEPEKKEASEAETQQERIREQLAEARKKVEAAQEEIDRKTPEHELHSFIAGRAGSEDYRSRQTTVSTIRRDFEGLVERLADLRDRPRETGPHPVERIVLYIDDLDRCPAPQVVEVLQAVHLLLALDLFVVVVGVDPRWLIASLRKEYAGLMPGPDDGDPGPASTPRSYLEKLFSVPFSLPRMQPDGFDRLMRSLAGGTEPGPTEAATAPIRPNADRSPADRPAEHLPVDAGSEVAALEADRRPEPRRLMQRELDMLRAVAPLIGTPREAKRLLNLYRLLRSTRDLSDASAFLGENAQSGEYRAVILLLALVTARADLLVELVGSLLHSDDGETIDSFFKELLPEPAHDGLFTNGVRAQLTPGEAAAWADLVHRAQPALRWLTGSDLTALRVWGPRVARFSFLASAEEDATRT